MDINTIGHLRALRKRAMPGPVRAATSPGYFGLEGAQMGPSIRCLGSKRQENQEFLVAVFNEIDNLLDEINRLQKPTDQFSELPLCRSPLSFEEAIRLQETLKPLLAFLSTPGDWGYNTKLGRLTVVLGTLASDVAQARETAVAEVS